MIDEKMMFKIQIILIHVYNAMAKFVSAAVKPQSK